MDPSNGKLPDDILRSVLRRLPMREAIKTSLVSKSWRYLWASSVIDIDFDRDNMPGISVPDKLDNYKERSPIFARTVDNFLTMHGATRIDTFRISFPMGDECNKHVDDWVRAAIRKQAKKLILDFRMCPRVPTFSTFPLHLLESQRAYSQLNHLQLDSCNLEIPHQMPGLASLKVLVLENVTVSNVQSLISSCCLLESLTMNECSGFKDIKFESSLGRLKHLKFQGWSFKSVAICCLNLVSIEELEAKTVLWNDELFSLQYPLPMTAGSIITPCPNLTRFEFLQNVRLCNMKLAEQDLINLFSVCPVLERLQLELCFFPRMPLHHRLKYLQVEGFNASDRPDVEVEICCGPCLIYVRWHKLLYTGDELMRVRLVNCDSQVFSSSSASPFTHLHLLNCISPQSNYAPFKYLQELSMTPGRLRDRDIWSLLSQCSHLQRLRLWGGGSRFRHFKIPFSSHPLKYLELKDNKFLDKVDLCSANLAFLELHTTLPVNLRVKQAPKLTRVSLGSWSEDTRDVTIKGIMELPSLIPRLETLTLFVGHSTSATETTLLARLPEFKHLKRLVIAHDDGYYPPQSCLWMVQLIHIAPELQIFELHLGYCGTRKKPNSDSLDDMEFLKRAHNHLKEVKITGFRGYECNINMAVYLLKYASLLELMTIETHCMCYEGDDAWKMYKEKRVDQDIRRRLMKHASSRTKLII